jgi:hypothetical protein
MGVGPQRRVLFACLVGLDDGRAAAGLNRDHARALGPDPADRLELVEDLPHANQPRAAAGRIEDRVGQLPAELLGKLEAHGLLALDPVGLLQGRAVEPAGRLLAVADNLAAIVDQAVDPVDSRAL